MQLDDPWGPFAKALEEGCNTDPADLLQRIEVELKRIGDEDLAAKVRTEAEKRADDAATLSRYLNSLKERQPKAA